MVLSDMKAKDDDHACIKKLFEMDTFQERSFLAKLKVDELKDYKTSLEAIKSTPNLVQATIDKFPDYANVKVGFFQTATF